MIMLSGKKLGDYERTNHASEMMLKIWKITTIGAVHNSLDVNLLNNKIKICKKIVFL